MAETTGFLEWHLEDCSKGKDSGNTTNLFRTMDFLSMQQSKSPVLYIRIRPATKGAVMASSKNRHVHGLKGCVEILLIDFSTQEWLCSIFPGPLPKGLPC